MKDFFISYNQADREWAEWIAWHLEEAAYTTILQAWDFRPGASFVVEMDRATREAHRTIPVLSDDYLEALYTHPEWAEAFRRDPKGQQRQLVPVRVRECDPQGLLGAIVYIDLVGLDEAGAREALLDGVRPGRAKPESRPAFPAGVERSLQARPAFPGALPPIWNVPHLRNPNFTGRESLLSAVEGALGKGQLAALTQQAIVGLGGVGKTQLALEYAYRHAQDYSVVWWVRSEEPAQLASDYASLAVELDLPQKGEPDQGVIVQAVRRWLEQNTGWLLILDNAPGPDAVRDYLPRGGAGHLLITSRDPNWGAVASPLTVEEFEREESVEFLHRRTGQEEGAAELADALGDLPLALEQAAAYIEAAGSTLTGYLQLYNTRRADLWEKERAPEGYRATVATTWSLAMDQVRSDSPPAAALLNLCAYLAPEDIPLSLLREQPDELPDSLAAALRDRVSLNDAVAALRRYSLVRVQGDSLSLHRLVQAVIADRLSDEDQRAWAAVGARLVSAAFPTDADEVRTWPVCARLLSHALTTAALAIDLDVATEEAAHLFNQAGVYLLARADLHAAKAALEHARRIHERVRGSEPRRVATTLINLASVRHALGDLEGARDGFERVMPMLEAAHGRDHPHVAMALSNLASLLYDLRDYTGAQKRLERALAIHEKAYGPNHPAVAIPLANLGAVLRELGDLRLAQHYHGRALAISEKARGPHDPHVAVCLTNLGMLLRDQGHLQTAREHFERALTINQKAYGADHPSVAIDHNNLACVLRDQGDRRAAREHVERALRSLRTSLGEDHPDTQRVRRNLESLDT